MEELLVERDVLERDDLVVAELEHAIDEQEWIAVRQQLEDALDLQGVFHLPLYSSLRLFHERVERGGQVDRWVRVDHRFAVDDDVHALGFRDLLDLRAGLLQQILDQLGPLASDDRPILAPVKLERFAKFKFEWHKSRFADD